MSADRITDEADLRNGLEESPASRLLRKGSGVETGSILLSSEEPRSEDIGISELFGDDAGDEMNRFPTGLTFSTVCSGGTLNRPGGSPQGKAGVKRPSQRPTGMPRWLCAIARSGRNREAFFAAPRLALGRKIPVWGEYVRS